MNNNNSDVIVSAPVLSVIIPIYNVEQYIAECLGSIPASCAWDMELILIDDGSPDGSVGIAEDMLASGRFVHTIIHQKNQGLSAARNTGMRHANGKYILFLDSDDMLDETGITHILSYLKTSDCDLIIGGYKKLSNSSESICRCAIRHGDFNKMPLQKALDTLAKDYECAVWTKIYKRSMLMENELFFTPGVFHEDVLWTPHMINSVKSVYHSGIVWYVYRVREGSIMTTFNVNKDLHKFICADGVFSAAKSCKSKKLRRKFYKIANDMFRTPIRNIRQYGENEAAMILEEAGVHIHVLTRPINPINLFRYAVALLFGVNTFAAISGAFSRKR